MLYASVVNPRCNNSRLVHVHCFLDAGDLRVPGNKKLYILYV